MSTWRTSLTHLYPKSDKRVLLLHIHVITHFFNFATLILNTKMCIGNCWSRCKTQSLKDDLLNVSLKHNYLYLRTE